ncbi:MAG: hypothetical protein BMS9Abin15_0011 [Gammaproteobacteria bacterium]|nr:MAG: hypothetical protein BMS9Abin15_0011 [Gammaproteobacteria bacterium]
MIERLCIIGVGLIGGSLALALRKAGMVKEIIGSGRKAENLEYAVKLGAIDRYNLDPSVAVTDADMVVLAVPLGAMGAVMTSIKDHLNEDTVLTDVGSAKVAVVKAAQKVFGCVPKNLVPAHPIAGHEKSGVNAADGQLFKNKRVILTPAKDTDPAAISKVRAMWQNTGANVMEMEVSHHDDILAATSHLPHVLAFALMHALANSPQQKEIFRYAAGGLRDFTRIASSDPVMWRDICLSNTGPILEALSGFRGELDKLEHAIRTQCGDELADIFMTAGEARKHFLELLESTKSGSGSD